MMDRNRVVCMTDTLKIIVETHMEGVTSEKQADQILDHVAGGIDHYKKQFLRIPKGATRAYNVHNIIDRTIKDDQKKRPQEWAKVSCKVGCSACCHKTVVVTADEADLLFEYAREKQVPLDLDLLLKQAAFDQFGKEDEWFNKPKSETKCIFLGEDKKCMVYEHRPASCRKFFVSTPPEDCDGPAGKQVHIKGDLDVELMASAALDIDQKRVGSLPEMLAKRIQREPF